MLKFLQKVKNYSLFMIVASAIMGIMLLFFPDQSIRYICIAAGAVMIGLGAYAIINYFVKNENKFLLIMGIIVAVFGIIVCAKYKTLMSLVFIIFGGFILCSGVIDFIGAIDAAKQKISGWPVTMILSIVAIAFGLVAIIRPFSVTSTLTRFIGAGLLVYAVMDIFSYIQIRNIGLAVVSAVKSNSEVDVEGTIIDE